MRVFITEVMALDRKTGELKTWAGPNITNAVSMEEAQEYCDNNGLGYCKVVGEKISEEDWIAKMN